MCADKIDLNYRRKVFHQVRVDIMSRMLGDFLVMCGGFFVVFFVLITCINIGLKNETRSERAISRRIARERELAAEKRLNRYR